MSLLEKAIEGKVVAWAEARKILQLKLNLQGNVGWPDRAFFFKHGLVVFIEFKRPGECLRPLQQYRAEELAGRGHYVFGCDSYKDGIAILEAARLSEKSDAVTDFPRMRGFVAGSWTG